MLAEILANPVAWPLWGVFLFAATMFPLGFLLPGCVCCASAGNCTECGILLSPYQSNQTEYGRMCCTGTIATSVTLRVTSTGPSTSNYVARGPGSPYQKITSTFTCTAMQGDYVLPLVRSVFADQGSCEWSVDTYSTCTTQLRITLVPRGYDPDTAIGVAFPSFFLSLEKFERTIPGSLRVQSCTGHPDPETCSIGTTVTANWLSRYSGTLGNPPMPKIRLEEQRCNPAGLTLSDDAVHRFFVSQNCESGSTYGQSDTGCEFRMELV